MKQPVSSSIKEKESKEREEKSEYSNNFLFSFEWNPPKNFLKTTWFWLPRSTMKGNENHNDFANVLNCTNRAFITWKLVSLPTVTHINDLPCNTRRDKFLARVIKAMVYKSTTNILHFVASKCWKQVLISNKYVWFTLKKSGFMRSECLPVPYPKCPSRTPALPAINSISFPTVIRDGKPCGFMICHTNQL